MNIFWDDGVGCQTENSYCRYAFNDKFKPSLSFCLSLCRQI
ncbi:hypothetical protein RchiOBHm_Chr2g0105141 [Rosa chinensis]|uniref:Uncharacterized protein n=1 Tax=Rosa chinensis TaxID=74649 RepID=A0A2P6RND0_ROSCH|nr:hypothetical protein RchiOBHm_Chr2g0105141 [Rosa chinensis]